MTSVRTVAPHCALFSQAACLGSMHDYAIFKKYQEMYAPYLTGIYFLFILLFTIFFFNLIYFS